MLVLGLFIVRMPNVTLLNRLVENWKGQAPAADVADADANAEVDADADADTD